MILCRNFRRIGLTVILIFWIQIPYINSQVSEQRIPTIPDSIGIENIRTYKDNNNLIISYENNIFRNKAQALSTIIDVFRNTNYDSLIAITLINGNPVIVTKLPMSKGEEEQVGVNINQWSGGQPQISYITDKYWKKIHHLKPENRHLNKFNLVVYPQILVKNARLDQIYEVQANLAPALEVALWRGMKITGQIILPLYNDYQFGDEGDQIRAGFITVSQEFKLPKTIFGRVVVGKFNNNRYGADVSLTRFLFNGQVYIGTHTGYTGEYFYYKRNWYRENIKTWTYLFKSGYFYKPYTLQLELTAGRFLHGDYGIRGDCTRYWNEIAIGFYALKAGNTTSGGFHFAVPFFPKRYKKHRTFQIRTPAYFDWEYNATSESRYGQYYETRPNENRIEHFYNPYFLTKTLRR